MGNGARLAAAIVILTAAPALAIEGRMLAGAARAVDGDTIVVAGARIRLAGIDAPERRQQCWAAAGVWSCGRIAAAALAALVEGRPVECVEDGRDRWRRVIARCSADGLDINAAMVRGGWALAYRAFSARYAGEEAAAIAAGAGIWGSSFIAPASWRRR